MKRILSIVVVLLVSTTLYSQSHYKRSPDETFQTEQPMVHDPVMAYEDSTYYIYSTGMGIQQMMSKDRKTWTIIGRPVMSVIPQWTQDSVAGFQYHVWAPDIIRWHGQWWMAYSCSTFGKNGSAIGLLSTRSLASGIWDDRGSIVTSREKFSTMMTSLGWFGALSGMESN